MEKARLDQLGVGSDSPRFKTEARSCMPVAMNSVKISANVRILSHPSPETPV